MKKPLRNRKRPHPRSARNRVPSSARPPAAPAGPRPLPPQSEDQHAYLTDRYNQQALNHANIQFWIGVVVALASFAWIIYALTAINLKQLGSLLNILPGIVTNAASLLFIRQVNKTRQRATEYYDRLRKDQQQAQAIALANAIADPQVRSEVQARMALHMLGAQPSPADGAALTRQLPSAPPARSRTK